MTVLRGGERPGMKMKTSSEDDSIRVKVLRRCLLEGSNWVWADIVNSYTDLAAQWAIGISVGNLLEPTGWHLRVWHLGGQHTSVYVPLSKWDTQLEALRGISFKSHIFFHHFFPPKQLKVKSEAFPFLC